MSNPSKPGRPHRNYHAHKEIIVPQEIQNNTQMIEEESPTILEPKHDPVAEFVELLLNPATPFIKRKQLITE